MVKTKRELKSILHCVLHCCEVVGHYSCGYILSGAFSLVMTFPLEKKDQFRVIAVVVQHTDTALQCSHEISNGN